MRIALDAMGGDAAPAEIVKGALLAVEACPEAEVLLVGDETAVQRELNAAGGPHERIVVRHAPDAIGMNESPVSALKKKPRSSIGVGFGLVAAGEADAIVSAGNTGAMVAGATLSLKLLQHVKRPGIATTFPTRKAQATLIDMGANVECKPTHLAQYGIMASIYHAALYGIERPRVGLMSVGEEKEKGSKLTKQTHEILEQCRLNFIGNVEGNDVFRDAGDVFVCDGFVGNVVLKLTEGLAEQLLAMLADEAIKDTWTRLGLKLIKPAIGALYKRLDFAEYGGAPLLGVNGIVIICHGRSGAAAIKNAVRAAVKYGNQNVNARIVDALDGVSDLWETNTEGTA